jgi:hypothetical protein
MKCFSHVNEEASGVCKKCGKAMCINCSAYSNHSGVCPACRLKEFEAEYEMNKSEIIKKASIAVLITVAVIAATIISEMFVLLSGVLISGILVLIMLPTIRRNKYLMGEITKICVFLQRGQAQI